MKAHSFRRILILGFSILFSVTAINTCAQNWSQLGSDIDGEASNNISGYTVDMPTSSTLAIGAPWNNDNGTASGQVRVFDWDGTSWVQRGTDIDGESQLDYFGTSVSMPDENTLAVGAKGNSDNGNESGHVRVYDWTGGTWLQRGSDIDGEAAGDQSGRSVDMPDANTLAIGAPFNEGSAQWSGHTRVYTWDGTNWLQKGSDIDGENFNNASGQSVSMPNANTLAIGAPFYSGIGYKIGHVRVYDWDGADWIQRGLDVDGESESDESGWIVSMPDANTVAIGAHYNDGNGENAGHVRVYDWNGLVWTQRGMDIDGVAAQDNSGFCVSMPDSNTLAIGAPLNDESGDDAGQARVFDWNGGNWIQRGSDMSGEAMGDQSGWAVSMPDANTLAIGAYFNNDNGPLAGSVSVYHDDNPTIIADYTLLKEPLIYPNPCANGVIAVELDLDYNTIQAVLTNELGKKVLSSTFFHTNSLNLNLNLPKGLYVLKLHADNGKSASLKVIIQ